jgi:hypothetical protein
MRRLRSPWAVLLLAPLFFLAGFGIVSALADGSERPAPQAAVETPSTGAPTAPASTASTPAATDSTATIPPPATEETTVATTPGDAPELPPAPPPGTVAVDYGRWDGIFRVAEAHVVRTYGASTITGRFGYAGGAGCPVKDVVMTGVFYDRGGEPVGEALWRSSWSGATRVTETRELPLEAYGEAAGHVSSARLRIAKVVCA